MEKRKKRAGLCLLFFSALAYVATSASVIAASAAADELPQYVDVTRAAGIDFRYVNGASGSKYMVEAVGSGAAFFDANGDGWLDLYIVDGSALPGYEGPMGANAYYQNSGGARFVDRTRESGTGDESFGMGAAVGDFDNDGDSDLYVTNYGPNILYQNNGTGIFSDITVSAEMLDGARTRPSPITTTMAISISTSPTIWSLTPLPTRSVLPARRARIVDQRPTPGRLEYCIATMA